jgi:hypothetical protein
MRRLLSHGRGVDHDPLKDFVNTTEVHAPVQGGLYLRRRDVGSEPRTHRTADAPHHPMEPITDAANQARSE